MYGRGTHWLCWYKNDKFYFDSFGVQPPNLLIEYFSSPILYYTERIQPDGEVVCGHLCLYVLYRLSRGEGFNEIINDLHLKNNTLKIIKVIIKRCQLINLEDTVRVKSIWNPEYL